MDVPRYDGRMKKHPDAAAKMYSSAEMDTEMVQKLAGSMERTDKEALACMVHSCNSFKYEQCLMPENVQRELYFEFGSRDSHIVCRKLIKRYYPKATITVRKGYGHCVYMFKHKKEYGDILKNYMDASEMARQ